jgi:hypothetical protein
MARTDLFAGQAALPGLNCAGRKVILTTASGRTRIVGEAFQRPDGSLEVYLTEVPSDGKITIAPVGA